MAPFGNSLRRLRDKVFTSDQDRRHAAIHTIPPLPTLPSSASVAAPSPSATVSSAFFQRLPLEIRRHILEAAFGDQTVHMHLSLERPLLRKHRPKQGTQSSSSSLAGHGWHPGSSAWDVTARPYWVWRSSVCHFSCSQHAPLSDPSPAMNGWSIGKDYCVEGWSCGEPNAPGSCGIGAMGWLLTCRQAYIEGYAVLYGTNTLRVHGTFMFAHIPELIPARSLESLTTVSLYWDMGWLRQYPRKLRLDDHPEDFSFLEGLEELLPRLPSTLSNVRCLHLSLQGFFWPEEQGRAYGRRSTAVYERAEELQRIVLRHVMQMRKMKDFRLALPRSLYLPWIQEVMDVTVQFDEPAWAELPSPCMRRDVPPELLQKEDNGCLIKDFLVSTGISDLPVLTPPCFR